MDNLNTMKVAIIGAGASGLTSVKACLEEGLQPVCFEKTNAIGGLWRYKENDKFPNLACVFKSTVVNTSKETMSFSDFPPPADFPNFMHNSLVFQYLNMYAEKFGVMDYIRFNSSVVSVREHPNGDGRWNVEVKNETNGDIETSVFNAVMVCVGHHANPYYPTFPGLEEFQGKAIHTHDYRKPGVFEDQEVLVVGIGNSAGDAAADLSRIASRVYLSTRRGAWLTRRTGKGGIPVDLSFSRFLTFFPKSVVNNVIENDFQKALDHNLYGLRPNHSPLSAHITVNDDLPSQIISGKVIIKSNIKRFWANSVEFDDGSREDIDAVIFGTGYVIDFPFLQDVNSQNNQVSLYKYVFSPDVSHPSSLAIIGLVQPFGSTIPIAEIQARWSVRVFKGLAHLPSKSKMLRDIALKKQVIKDRYVDSQRHTIQVDFLSYMDEVATEFGVKPDLWGTFIQDPKFWWRLMFGPSLSYQYRLQGPGKWHGAKHALETYWDRVIAPFNTRQVNVPKEPESGWSRRVVVALLIVLAAYWFLK